MTNSAVFRDFRRRWWTAGRSLDPLPFNDRLVASQRLTEKGVDSYCATVLMERYMPTWQNKSITWIEDNCRAQQADQPIWDRIYAAIGVATALSVPAPFGSYVCKGTD